MFVSQHREAGCEPSCPSQARPAIEEHTERMYSVLPFRLSLAIHTDVEHTHQCIKDNPFLHYFSTTWHESYQAFGADFGPVNLLSVAKFCAEVRKRLNDPRIAGRHLIYYCYPRVADVVNAAFLLGSYLVLEEGWAPEVAAGRFSFVDECASSPFCDVSSSDSTFDLTVLDCLNALKRATENEFWSLESFDSDQYDRLAEHSMHVVCPKFVACRCPGETGTAAYTPVFHALDVKSVVRLNDATYDKSLFLDEGFSHHDLYFEDGVAPSLKIVNKFLKIVKDTDGVVAVHCLAGLGRTGTLIAVWLMRAYSWSARDAIAWLRIVRPGSVIGQQQNFLARYEHIARNWCTIMDEQMDATFGLCMETGSNHPVSTHEGCCSDMIPQSKAEQSIPKRVVSS